MLLGLLPALLLAVLLAFGVYPGEELIARIGRSSRRRPSPPAATLPPRPAAASVRLLLLAASRPLRGPPRLSPVHG